jgi:hypothetical protein
MEYISIHRVLRKGLRRITIFFVVALLLPIPLFILALELTNSYFLAVLIIVLAIVVLVMLAQHVYLNWLIWAVKHVDNIPQFLTAGGGYHLINSATFPKVRTIFPYRNKKKEIEDIVFERKAKGLYVIELGNASHLAEVSFYKSFVYYGLFLLLGLFFLSILFIAPFSTEFAALAVKFVGVAIGLPITFWAIKNLLDREPVFSINKYSITVKNKELRWSEIEDISTNRSVVGHGRNRQVDKNIKITYRKKDGTLDTLKVDVSSLNVSIAKADEIIKTYKRLSTR